MRWDGLFADLEASVEAADRAAFDAEVADLARAERAALGFVDRLAGHRDVPVALLLADGDEARGPVLGTGRDWVLLGPQGPAGVPALVPLAAVLTVDGLGRASAPAPDPEGPPRLRPGLATALRVLARDRAVVRVRLRGGTVLAGTVDRVGADHLDLALHPVDEPRRPAAVTGVRTVPFAALVVVRGGVPDRTA